MTRCTPLLRWEETLRALCHVLTTANIENLTKESTPTIVKVAGDRVLQAFTLKLNKRLADAAKSVHVWVNVKDKWMEHPRVREFRRCTSQRRLAFLQENHWGCERANSRPC